MNCSKSTLIHHATALKIDATGTCKELLERINKKLGTGHYKYTEAGNVIKNSKNIFYFLDKYKNNTIICPTCGVEYPQSKFRTLCGQLKDDCMYCRIKKENE